MSTVTTVPQVAIVEHPTGSAAFATTVLVWIATSLGLDMSPEVAVAIVGLASVAVSYFTPRFGGAAQVASNVPAHGGTGPDEEA